MFPRRNFHHAILWSVGAVFLVLALSEPLYALIQRPEGTVYTNLHNYHEDYFYYLHIMRQGYDGAWLVTSRMTPEVYPVQFAVPFFVLLGKVGRLLPISMEGLYFTARASGAVALIAVIYVLAARLFQQPVHRIWAMILTLAGGYVPIVHEGKLDVPSLVRNWSELDPLARLAFIPHHLWSKIIMVVLLLLLAKNGGLRSAEYSRTRTMIIVLFFTLAMGFISPVILVTYGVTLTLWMAGEWATTYVYRRSMPIHTLLPYSVSMIAAGLVAVYHWYLSHSTFPWTTYGPPWENNWLLLFTPSMYAGTFGMLFALALVGIGAGYKKDTLIRMLASWMASGWLLSFVLRPLLPFSGSRYLAGYQWIAVGSLAVYGLAYIASRFAEHRKYVFFSLACLALAVSVPAWYMSIQDRTQFIDKNLTNPQIFASQKIIDTLTYFRTIPSSGCIVAAPDWMSTMIAAYSACRSVSGHRLMTYANDIKVYEMNEFFFGMVPLVQKAARLGQYRISHVITMERITGDDILPLLSPPPLFATGGIRVYKTR